MKRFNTTAICIPSMHYMVDLSERVNEIRKMVEAGEYFTINRARQYGKTTTLDALERNIFSEKTGIKEDGWLNVEKIMAHFILSHNQICKDSEGNGYRWNDLNSLF